MHYAAGAQTLNYFKIKDFKAKFGGKKWSWMGELTVLTPPLNKEPFERERKRFWVLLQIVFCSLVFLVVSRRTKYSHGS